MSNTMTIRSPKQKRSKQRVESILDAARSVLRTEGIKSLTTNSIAAYAKIPVSSIYQYFPNKEVILVTLYEDYLAEVRESYETMASAETSNLPWREYCTLLIDRLLDVETEDNIDEEFEIALGLYPELKEIDKVHEEWLANRLADDFRRLGSRWPKAKLKRLAHFVYEYNSAVWQYRSKHRAPKNELHEWTQASFLALAEKCFDNT